MWTNISQADFLVSFTYLEIEKKIGMQVMRGNTEGMRKREGKKVGMVNYNRTSLYTH